MSIAKRSYIKHGLTNSREKGVYYAMKQRCYDTNSKAYKNYGGRGIEVCDRWLESFKNFYDDMGKRPGVNYSLDRINNDGNYEPNNCRWADKITQSRNKRSSKTTKSGFNGVSWDKYTQKWFVTIGINNKTIHLGRHSELNKAIQVRKDAEAKYWS